MHRSELKLLLIALVFIWSCGDRSNLTSHAPMLKELREATYTGVFEAGDAIRLRGGEWESGSVGGGNSRARVRLIERLLIQGDVDLDGDPDAISFLSHSLGGSGSFLSLVFVVRSGGGLDNPATIPLGDRVQIRGATLDSGIVRVDLVEHGVDDAMCCPGDLITRTWQWNGTTLEETSSVREGRLTPDVLGDSYWRLRAWNSQELVPDSIQITLTYADGRLTGTSGCNRFSADVRLSTIPGDISCGPIAGTKMMCSEYQMKAEGRFLHLLQKVNQFGFLNGDIFFGYKDGESIGAMVMEREHKEKK